MIKIIITETCRAKGRNQQWCRFKDHEINADSIKEAKEELRAYLEHIYNVKRSKPVYVDTKSRGTIRNGYIYSGTEGSSNYLRAWCSVYTTTDNKELRSIDLDAKEEK